MKCDYKGCARQCCGDVNDELCNVLRAYHQGKTETKSDIAKECKYILACGMGKKKALEHLIEILEKEQNDEK